MKWWWHGALNHILGISQSSRWIPSLHSYDLGGIIGQSAQYKHQFYASNRIKLLLGGHDWPIYSKTIKIYWGESMKKVIAWTCRTLIQPYNPIRRQLCVINVLQMVLMYNGVSGRHNVPNGIRINFLQAPLKSPSRYWQQFSAIAVLVECSI